MESHTGRGRPVILITRRDEVIIATQGFRMSDPSGCHVHALHAQAGVAGCIRHR